MMELSERIMNVLESHDISLCGEISERTYDNDGYDVELETYSPEGEDVIISLIYDGTEEDFICQFRSYAENFDAEEHAEMWIECRGENGAPNSIKDLLEDAEWQKEMLLKVARELSCEDNKCTTEEELSSEEKLAKIKEVLSQKDGITDSQEFGLTYSQILNYLDEIEEIVKWK